MTSECSQVLEAMKESRSPSPAIFSLSNPTSNGIVSELLGCQTSSKIEFSVIDLFIFWLVLQRSVQLRKRFNMLDQTLSSPVGARSATLILVVE